MTIATPYAGYTGKVPVVPRDEFLSEWDYQGGHLTMIGPTRRGKTTLGVQLLGKSVSPEFRVTMFSGKPAFRDRVMSDSADKLNLRVLEEWPPDPRFGDKKRNGYLLRPKHTLTDPDADDANLKRQFRRAYLSNYASKKRVISYVDESHQFQNDLGLKKEYEKPLMRGLPHNSVWSNLQRGRFSSYLAYDAPEHLFIFNEPDVSNKRRYSEIGGIDPVFLANLSDTLKTYEIKNKKSGETNTISECIYIRRSGPYVCVVDVT